MAGFLSWFKTKNRKSIKLNSLSTLIVVLITCVNAFTCFSQDVPAKLAAFNEAVGKEYNAFNKGKFLMIEGYREGKQVKLDKINIYDLEFETIKFSVKDQSVSVKCYSDLDGCVERVLMLNKKKSYKKRMVFGISEGVDGEEVAAKFQLLLNDMAKTY